MIFDKFTLSLITAILGFGIWNIQRFMEDRKNAHAKVLKHNKPIPRHLCGN
jgi:flagellar biogenesis protein FliO